MVCSFALSGTSSSINFLESVDHFTGGVYFFDFFLFDILVGMFACSATAFPYQNSELGASLSLTSWLVDVSLLSVLTSFC